MYALQFFLPQLVASLAHGTATLTAATLAALPYGVAALAMLAWSHRSIDARAPKRAISHCQQRPRAAPRSVRH